MSFKKLILCIGIAFLATSCFQNTKPEKPDNLISKDKMVNLLIDLKLMSLANNPLDLQTLREHGINPDNYAFKKHHVDSLQFALSHDYYTYHTKEYDKIFARVMDSLERLKEHYKAEELISKNTTSQNHSE